jgi:hypothetical protein
MEVQIDGHNVLIDEEYLSILNKFKWRVKKGNSGGFYLKRFTNKGKRVIFFHRFIMDTPSNMQTDHIDGNTLNNTRSNLRICSISENQWNRTKYKTNKSGYKGVSYYKPNGMWVSQIQKNKQKYFMGYYKTPELAYEEYKKKAIELHGEFAHF